MKQGPASSRFPMPPWASIRRLQPRGSILTRIEVVPADERSPWPDAGRAEDSMLIDYVLGGVVTAALLVYLSYVLLRPERF